MIYSLEAPASDADWQAFHDIRDAVLFKGRHRDVVYNRNHPDDFKPDNRPLLFKVDGQPLGVIRLDDFGDGTGAVRLVAITQSEQGNGHGRVMSEMCDALARELGMHTLYVNAAPEALGYYDKLGWERFIWDPAELIEIARDCEQMRKALIKD